MIGCFEQRDRAGESLTCRISGESDRHGEFHALRRFSDIRDRIEHALCNLSRDVAVRARQSGATLDLPSGSRLIVVGFLMALVLILRPSGLTGGREFSLAWLGRVRG